MPTRSPAAAIDASCVSMHFAHLQQHQQQQQQQLYQQQYHYPATAIPAKAVLLQTDNGNATYLR